MPSSNSNPGCLGALITFLQQFLPGQNRAEPKPLPYRLRDDFLTPAELSFYRVLLHAAGEGVTVCPKVRLADLFFVARPDRNRRFFNYIVAKHVDFVLCALQTMSPLLAVELDDASHKNFDRQDRDAFVERVFADAHVPLLRVPARRQYEVGELRDLLAPHLPLKPADAPAAPLATPPPVQTTSGALHPGGNGKAASPTAPVEAKTGPAAAARPESNPAAAAPQPAPGAAPLCPKCGIPMLLRTVAMGEHRGKQFYGCRNFPHCREVRSYRPQK